MSMNSRLGLSLSLLLAMSLLPIANAEKAVQVTEPVKSAAKVKPVAKAKPAPKKSRRPKPPTKFVVDREKRQMEGWTVYVDKALLADPETKSGAVGELALRILSNKLFRLNQILPEKPLAHIKKVNVFIDYQHFLGGAHYHPSQKWLVDHNYEAELAKGVHVTRAQLLIKQEQSQQQPWVMLHEFAHAYHDQVLKFSHPEILASYQAAKAKGNYMKVRHVNGNMSRAYAMADHKEYFSELTEAYFGKNDFYPFVRPEIKDHDPKGYALMQLIWKK